MLKQFKKTFKNFRIRKLLASAVTAVLWITSAVVLVL